MENAGRLLAGWLGRRLPAAAAAWLERAAGEVAAGAAEERFGALFSGASRFVKDLPLAPTRAERAELAAIAPELVVERWSELEAARVRLLLARGDLAAPGAVAAIEALFRYADEGELRALHRSLAFLPAGERFAWRAGEGCRSNMRSVFEAAACDTPFPARHFDPIAFRQGVIKAIFIGAPVGRIVGLAERRDEELARMALDLADERRSAGRPVPGDLWLAVGPFGGERAAASLVRELARADLAAGERRAAEAARARLAAASRAGAR